MRLYIQTNKNNNKFCAKNFITYIRCGCDKKNFVFTMNVVFSDENNLNKT